MRWHQSGDTFSEEYALAICEVARRTPHLIHYLYTKCLHIWLPIIMDELVPDNLLITASWGGKYDHLIQHSYAFPRNSRVVFTEGEAETLGLLRSTTTTAMPTKASPMPSATWSMAFNRLDRSLRLQFNSARSKKHLCWIWQNLQKR